MLICGRDYAEGAAVFTTEDRAPLDGADARSAICFARDLGPGPRM